MGRTSSGNHLELVAPAADDEQLSVAGKPRNVAPQLCVGGIGGGGLLFCLNAIQFNVLQGGV